MAAARPAAELVRGGGGEVEGQQRPELHPGQHRVPGDRVVRVQVQRRARVRLAAGRCYTPLHSSLYTPCDGPLVVSLDTRQLEQICSKLCESDS